MADIRTEQPARTGHELRDVLALYAPLLAGLRAGRSGRPAGVTAGGRGRRRCGAGRASTRSFPRRRSGSTPFDYQLQAARGALRRMRGRAILADEVGLGKTIEAGLILAELRLRGLADRTLVIVPAGLVTQWREELERKFGVPTVRPAGTAMPRAASGTGSVDRPVVVASLAAARRDPLKSALTARPVGLDHRGRGAPGALAAQRLGEAGPRAAVAAPAAADRHAGGEPAAGPVRAGEPGRARPARHRGAVPRARTARAGRAGHEPRNVAGCGSGPPR